MTNSGKPSAGRMLSCSSRSSPRIESSTRTRIARFWLKVAEEEQIRKLEMPGCLTPATNSLHDSPEMGTPSPSSSKKTDTDFAIGWKGNYHIEGRAFVYADRQAGRIITILGYPTAKIAQLG